MISDESKLAWIARSEAEPRSAPGGWSSTDQPREEARGGAEVELELADLVADANGEIVFFNDSGFRSLAIRTDRSVVADGQAGAHVTAAGDDVTGFQFLTFDNGLTLYFEPGMHLAVLTMAPPPSP
jgi:hypothetical protein